jgi:hypothetical protein
MGVARQAEIQQIGESFVGAGSWNRFVAHETPKNLRDFDVQQMWGMQGFAVQIDSVLNALPCWCLEEPVNRGRRVEDDHRESRSSRTN